jgi:putative membrane protein
MKRFNINELVWFLILFSLSLVIGSMLYTEKIYILIHPKMKLYLIVAEFILCIFTVIQFPKVFTIPDRGGVRKNYIIFIFSILMVVMASRINMSTTYLEFKGVNLFPYFDDHSIKEKHNHENEIPSGVIQLKGENFYCYLEDLQKNIDFYKGRSIEVEGMIYKKKDLNKNQFIVTRLVMNCCAADSQYVGVVCEYEGTSVNETQWVRIHGEIIKTRIKDTNDKEREIPLVKVRKIENIEEPQKVFIYQN